MEMVLTEVQLGGQALVPEFLGLNASSISQRPSTSHVKLSVPQLSSMENGHNINTEIAMIIYIIIT